MTQLKITETGMWKEGVKYTLEDGTMVTCVRDRSDTYTHTCYEVYDGEQKIGRVQQTSAYVERRPKGSRIVTARWSRQEWRYVQYTGKKSHGRAYGGDELKLYATVLELVEKHRKDINGTP
jgi:hypothetical protein